MATVACFLNVDKPAGITSRDVVDRVGRVVDTKRLGHAGTLDPLATGVLVLAVGSATRLVEYVQRMPKTYLADVRLGETSTTDDAEGEITETADAMPPDAAALRDALAAFVGTIQQRPPAFSALKVAGQRAYRLARKGNEVDLAPRAVVVHKIDLLEYAYPAVRLSVACGGGTYIRAIARDLGDRLGVGGLLSALRRTAIGSYTAASAVALDDLSPDTWTQHARPLTEAVAPLPRITLAADVRQRFLFGQHLPLAPGDLPAGEIAVFDAAGQFLGIGRYDPALGNLRATKAGFAD